MESSFDKLNHDANSIIQKAKLQTEMSIVYHLITMKIIEMNNQPFIGHPIIIVLEQTNDTYKNKKRREGHR